MKKTSKITFMFFSVLVLSISIAVSLNHIYQFQSTKIDLNQKTKVAKLIGKISSKDLSFKKALFYEVIEESDVK